MNAAQNEGYNALFNSVADAAGLERAARGFEDIINAGLSPNGHRSALEGFMRADRKKAAQFCLALARAGKTELVTKAFSKPRVIAALCSGETDMDQGEVRTVFDTLALLKPGQLTRACRAEHAVHAMARMVAEARELMGLFRPLEPHQKADIYTTPGAAETLVRKGCGKTILEDAVLFNAEQREAVFTARGAEDALDRFRMTPQVKALMAAP